MLSPLVARIGIDWANRPARARRATYMELRVLEDTPTLHHVIVCTLCSCYPRPLLGHSPYWVPFAKLSSPAGPLAAPGAGRIRLDPAARGRDQGRGLEPEMPLHGLPLRPAESEKLDEEQLAEIVTRDCMIGVALAGGRKGTMSGRSTRPAGRSAASTTNRDPAQ